MSHRGFALADVLGLLSVVGLGVLLLLAAMPEPRRVASLTESKANLRRFAGATFSYAEDHADRFWGFSWKKGGTYSQFPDLNNAPTDLQAHADQAVDIIRRRMQPNMPKMSNWVADLLYGPLVLAEYLDLSLPDRFFASPADATLLLWQDDPAKVPPGGPDMQRWRASSSYEMPTAFFSFPWSGSSAVQQSSTHNAYFVPPTAEFGGRMLSEVSHPSLKVFLHDRFQRHFGPRTAFFGYREARVLTLLGDGSADVRKTRATNRGWNPAQPTFPSVTAYTYSPAPWEPPVLPVISPTVEGHYRWTRKALEGRDFGGSDL